MGLEREFIHEFLINLKPITFDKNTKIINIGETSDKIYLLTKGIVDVTA
jgi:CRP-like cAMP-binding protein